MFDAKAFRKTLVYERTATPDAILRDVAILRNLDREGERKRRRLLWLGVTPLVVAVLMFFLAGVVVEQLGDNAGLWFGASGVLVLFGSGALIYRAANKRLDTEDRRYELLGRVIGMLRTDMRTGDTIAVRLDLGRPDTSAKSKGEGTVRSWKVKYFEDPWLTLRGRFADDTRFALDATEKFQKRSKWATSSSGKMKHKSKTKSATELLLHLKVKTKRYPGLENLRGKIASAIRVPSGVAVKRVVGNPDGLGLRVLLKGPWDCSPDGDGGEGIDGTRLVASMFLSLYQVLNLSKAIAKGSPRVA